nr:CHASE3 domain-containing protein [Chthoniobacterales bacterium]
MKKSPRPEQGRFVYFRRAWRSLPLARKAVLAVVLPILALLAGFVLLYVFAEAEQRAHHGLGASVRTRNYLNIIYRGVLSEEASVHGFALTRDQALLLPFDSARHTAAAAFQELAPLLADDPAQASRVVAFRGAVEQRFAVLEQLRDAAQEADPGAGATLAPLITSGHEWAAANARRTGPDRSARTPKARSASRARPHGADADAHRLR